MVRIGEHVESGACLVATLTSLIAASYGAQSSSGWRRACSAFEPHAKPDPVERFPHALTNSCPHEFMPHPLSLTSSPCSVLRRHSVPVGMGMTIPVLAIPEARGGAVASRVRALALPAAVFVAVDGRPNCSPPRTVAAWPSSGCSSSPCSSSFPSSGAPRDRSRLAQRRWRRPVRLRYRSVPRRARCVLAVVGLLYCRCLDDGTVARRVGHDVSGQPTRTVSSSAVHDPLLRCIGLPRRKVSDLR